MALRAISTLASPGRSQCARSANQVAEVFIIANEDTVASRPHGLKRPVGPNETLLSIDKARRMLGYSPSGEHRPTHVGWPVMPSAER